MKEKPLTEKRVREIIKEEIVKIPSGGWVSEKGYITTFPLPTTEVTYYWSQQPWCFTNGYKCARCGNIIVTGQPHMCFTC